ncbi:hypothetical protein [Prescottella equi]|uniref:hypothetical protein n=1 Tax=Rhodococcus hoagii TaxID=43767 RepID=UPI002740772E|nr:hypothetical protein [Prescottella equi]
MTVIKSSRLAPLACLGILLTACSSESPKAVPEASTAATNTSTSALANVADRSEVDRLVCIGDAGLERWGLGIYSTYKDLLLGNNSSLPAVTLARQLNDLTMIGSSGGTEDGSKVVNEASPEIRLAMTKMIQDADRKAQHLADAANRGFGPDNDVTKAMTSYTQALTACTLAGYQPSWFDIEELTGN